VADLPGRCSERRLFCTSAHLKSHRVAGWHILDDGLELCLLFLVGGEPCLKPLELCLKPLDFGFEVHGFQFEELGKGGGINGLYVGLRTGSRAGRIARRGIVKLASWVDKP
jgi:hypothetical protein